MAYHRQQRRRHVHRAHLQHLRAAHAAQRRSGRAHLRPPGAAGKPLTVFGDGSQTRSFCYVDDLIDGLFRLAASGEHEPVNIGNPAEMTLLELAKHIIRAARSKSQVVFEALPLDDPRVRRPDITRARAILKWEPKVTLAEGLTRLVDFERHNRPHSLTGLQYQKPAVKSGPAPKTPKRPDPH